MQVQKIFALFVLLHADASQDSKIDLGVVNYVIIWHPFLESVWTILLIAVFLNHQKKKEMPVQ